MRSVITAAVLATAVFGQAMGATVHRHGHAHLHQKKGEEAAKRAVGDVVTATIDGKIVTWVNEYDGAVAEATAAAGSVVAAASSVIASVVSEVTSAAAAKTSKAKKAKATSTASSASSSSTGTSSSLSSADQARLAKMGVKVSDNPAYTSGSYIGLGSGGAFELDFTNSADEDVILVLWSAAGQSTAWSAMEVCENTASITVSIPCGETTTVSFNPENYSGSSISGAWAAIYSDTTLTYAGTVGNTWGEYTFTSENDFSTTDVSRLVAAEGNSMSITNYKSKGGDKTCVTDMDTCVFVCTDSAASSCMDDYTLSNCPVGAAGNTADASGQNGGCSYEGTSGYSLVVFS